MKSAAKIHGTHIEQKWFYVKIKTINIMKTVLQIFAYRVLNNGRINYGRKKGTSINCMACKQDPI